MLKPLKTTTGPSPSMLSNHSLKVYYASQCAGYNIHPNSAFLQQLPDDEAGLRVVSLRGEFLGAEGGWPVLDVFSKCENVEVLDLCGVGLTNEGVVRLVNCLVEGRHTRLHTIDVSHNAMITVSGAKALCSLIGQTFSIERIILNDTLIPPTYKQKIQSLLLLNA
eukprot:gene5867-15899_t